MGGKRCGVNPTEAPAVASCCSRWDQPLQAPGWAPGWAPRAALALTAPKRGFLERSFSPRPTAPAIPAPVNALGTRRFRRGLGRGSAAVAGEGSREVPVAFSGGSRSRVGAENIHRLEKFPSQGGSQTSCGGERDLALPLPRAAPGAAGRRPGPGLRRL